MIHKLKRHQLPSEGPVWIQGQERGECGRSWSRGDERRVRGGRSGRPVARPAVHTPWFRASFS